MNHLLVFLACALGAACIHGATRACLGLRADALPGGALVMAGMAMASTVQPGSAWAAALLGAVVGHALGVWGWNKARQPPLG